MDTFSDSDLSYSHSEHCSNCNRLQSFRIPKGVTIDEFISNRNCNNCGCKMRGSIHTTSPSSPKWGTPKLNYRLHCRGVNVTESLCQSVRVVSPVSLESISE